MKAQQNRIIRPSVSPSGCYKSCINYNSKTTDYRSKFMKFYRKIKHNEKMCRAQEVVYGVHGQGHNQRLEMNKLLASVQILFTL